MSLRSLLLISTTLSLPVLTNAWGTLGHETVALIAQNYIQNSTKLWAQKVLNSSSTTYLADVATWADSYRNTAAGKFSAPFHYIDAEDDPPHSCGVEYQRDCGSEGCVVSALANYTVRVKDKTLSSFDRLDALRFVIHFVGDIHQPLHDEAFAIGGNGINVTFASKKTNLHHIWDTEMPEKLIGNYSMDDAKRWAANLTTDITEGAYTTQSGSWLKGINVTDPISTSLGWAQDSNAYVCSTVVPDGTNAYEGKELSGSYYDSSIPVIELQIAKAGYRLAAWLDLIANGKTKLGRSHKTKSGHDDSEYGGISFELPTGYNDYSRAKLARRAAGHRC